MTTGRLYNVRALDGDPDHDGWVLRTVGGVPVWMPGGIEGLTSVDDSVTITDNGDGTWNLAAAGGGGGGAAFAGAKVHRSAAYSLANNAVTSFPWDVEDWDTNAFHDNATNNTRLTVPTGLAGKYIIKAAIGVSVSGATYPRFRIGFLKNGSSIAGGTVETSIGSGAFPVLSVVADDTLAVGDYVEAFYFQTSGASRAADTGICAFSMFKVG